MTRMAKPMIVAKNSCVLIITAWMCCQKSALQKDLKSFFGQSAKISNHNTLAKWLRNRQEKKHLKVRACGSLPLGQPIRTAARAGQSAPTSHQSSQAGEVELRLLDSSGRFLAQWQLDSRPGQNNWELPLQNWPPGAYCLQALQGSSLVSHKIVKF
jgi:hypothetical protein